MRKTLFLSFVFSQFMIANFNTDEMLKQLEKSPKDALKCYLQDHKNNIFEKQNLNNMNLKIGSYLMFSSSLLFGLIFVQRDKSSEHICAGLGALLFVYGLKYLIPATKDYLQNNETRFQDLDNIQKALEILQHNANEESSVAQSF